MTANAGFSLTNSMLFYLNKTGKSKIASTCLTLLLNLLFQLKPQDVTLLPLEDQGKIQKIYGGIKLVETHFGEPAMENRLAAFKKLRCKLIFADQPV